MEYSLKLLGSFSHLKWEDFYLCKLLLQLEHTLLILISINEEVLPF